MGDLFSQIREAIAAHTPRPGSRIILTSSFLPLDRKNFAPLAADRRPLTVAFVDGGNAEILTAANLSVHFIRLYATVYEDNKRSQTFQREFYALITAKEDFTYAVQTFGTNFTIANFSAADETLTVGVHRATPSAIGDAVRQQAELAFAAETAQQLPAGAIIVRDGDLEPTITGTQERMATLLGIVRERQLVLAGLAKTTTLLTDTGASAAVALHASAPSGTWLYGAGSMTHFVKLHPRSSHVFRLDVLPPMKATEVAAALAANATDAAFPGYPYGLIEADKFAQVPKHEAGQLRIRLLARGRKDLQQHLHAVDAHDILNAL
jgi:hypothetical protein